MYKQSPSRNHRSKGIKVKHILQVCLLLAVCFWLIYQVKHSHEKRKEFDAKDEKVVAKVETDGVIRTLGRKDLPRITEIATDGDKHEEDDEEKDEDEEEIKHEKDDPEREESKAGEMEEEADKGRGDGDDEIDENEPERTEAEHEREEDSVDEDKEKEENDGASEENLNENEEIEDVGKEDHSEGEENEGAGKEDHTGPEENEDARREDQTGTGVTSDDQDHDGGSTNTREAREEQYKADDASSEVAHDIQTIIPETKNVTSGHANEMFGKANFGHENETIISREANALIQSGVLPRQEYLSNNGTANATVTGQKNYETNLTKSVDSSLDNSTLRSVFIDQPENSSNSTASLLSSNLTQTTSDSKVSRNATGEGTTGDEDPNLRSNILESTNKTGVAVDDKIQSEAAADSNKTETVNSNAEDSLRSGNVTLDNSHKANAVAAEEDTSLHHGEKSNNSGTTGSDESSEYHSSDEGADGVRHDPIDASDTSLTQEERESRTDLDTLPEIRAEVQETDNSVAE